MRSSPPPPPPEAVTSVVRGNSEAVSYIRKIEGTCVTEWLELKERKHVFKEAVINYCWQGLILKKTEVIDSLKMTWILFLRQTV